MLKIAYIYDVNNKYTYANRTVASGFRNAFQARGDQFTIFDTKKLSQWLPPWEKINLVTYKPDIIFASVSAISYLPVDLLKNSALVLWGEFFSPCYYEEQIDNLSEPTKAVLRKYSSRNNILVWSQHDDLINEKFFGGYERELGVGFIQLLHCADKNQYIEPILQPDTDFLWIGNTSHRLEAYNSFILPLKEVSQNYIEHTEKNMITPEDIYIQGLYQKCIISPNIHTEAQIKHNILVNERVFSSSIMGGFQICDNVLAKKYFNEDELVIATSKDEFIDLLDYYRKNLTERFKMVKKMQANILANHTYFNRIDSILK